MLASNSKKLAALSKSETGLEIGGRSRPRRWNVCRLRPGAPQSASKRVDE